MSFAYFKRSGCHHHHLKNYLQGRWGENKPLQGRWDEEKPLQGRWGENKPLQEDGDEHKPLQGRWDEQKPLQGRWFENRAVMVLKPKPKTAILRRNQTTTELRFSGGHVTVFLEFQKWPSPVTNIPKQPN